MCAGATTEPTLTCPRWVDNGDDVPGGRTVLGEDSGQRILDSRLTPRRAADLNRRRLCGRSEVSTDLQHVVCDWMLRAAT